MPAISLQMRSEPDRHPCPTRDPPLKMSTVKYSHIMHPSTALYLRIFRMDGNDGTPTRKYEHMNLKHSFY